MTSGNGGSAPKARDPEIDRARLRAIHASLTSGDIATAGKAAEDALAEGLDHPMVLSLVAGRREQQGRFEESLALLRRAKAAAPGAIGLLNAAGLCLAALERFEEAVAEYDAALSVDPRFAPALANRGTAKVALAKLVEARSDFEASLAVDPENLVALNGLAALALRRGEAAEARRLAQRVTARQPDFPGALLTLAGADIEEGKAGVGEARLKMLLADGRIQPVDAAVARGLLGDALDAQDRFEEAFEAYEEGNRLRRDAHRSDFAGRPGTLAFVREVAAALRGRKVARTWGHETGPAKRHVFLVGFPRSGTTLLEQVLAGHPEVITLAEKECMIDGARQWMTDTGDFRRMLAASEAELDPWREAYWRRVAEEGIEPAGKVFVDKHPFHTFKLPLIARLFPEARILFARRDPRDVVLSCFRHRFQMTEPIYQLLTLKGAAELFAATMELVEATEEAFGLFMQPCTLEAIIADFDRETKAICDYVGLEWRPDLRDFARHIAERGVFTPSAPQLAKGLNAGGVGKWRDYARELAPVIPILQPWIDRFGY